MNIRPILSALLRNPTGAVLVALQVAITLAVVCNAGFIVQQRLALIHQVTGYDLDNVVTVQTITTDPGPMDAAYVARDLRALRAIPGVIAASATPQVPLGGAGFATGFSRTDQPDDPSTTNASLVMLDEQGLDALGLQLTAGRWFRPEEVVTIPSLESLSKTRVPSIVLSRALADRLFPDGDAVGNVVYDVLSRLPATVVGVVERAKGYSYNRRNFEETAFWPATLTLGSQTYVLRARPGELGAVLQQVEDVLIAENPRRIVEDLRSLADVRDASYRNDRAMAVTLIAVIALLVAVTVLGIFGLMSFNVSRRRKQIGTRRALGARRGDIIRHFLVESWLVTAFGAAVGVVLAVGLSVWLVNEFELPKLDWRYLPAGIIAIWAIGQAAAFGPARRAAEIEPAIATRSV